MMNSSELSVILKERLRNELSGTVTNALNKLIKSSGREDLGENEIEKEEDELLKAVVAEVTQTERYWKTRNNILLDSRRLHLEPTPVRSSYSYLPNDQIDELGELLYHPNLELRLKSLDYLLRCVSNETLLLLPGWKRLENGLRLNSLHDVSVLSEVSLQVYNKFLNSSDSRLVKEIYISLLKTLGVRLNPISKPDSNPRVRILTVLVHFLKNLPRKWVRFPEPAIDGIVYSTIYALDSCQWNNDDEELGLAYSFGVVDPHSDWLKNLLLSAPVRLKFFEYIKSTSFINQVVEIIMTSFEKIENKTSVRNITSFDQDDMTSFEKDDALTSRDGVEKIITSFENIENLTSQEGDENLTSQEGDENLTSQERDENLTSQERDENLTSSREKIDFSLDLLASISVICRLFEVKDGYVLIGNDNEAWIVWDKIVKIVSRISNGENFFSIESILERNAGFSPQIIGPFLTNTVDHLLSLNVLSKALANGKLELTPEMSLLITDYLIKEASLESDRDLLIDIYSRLIPELTEIDIKPFYQMIGNDFRVYRFLSKLSRNNKNQNQIEEIRKFSDKTSFLEYLRSTWESFEQRHLPDLCEHCQIGFIRDTLGLAKILGYVKEAAEICLKSIWNRVTCFCDHRDNRIFKYLENIYANFVPYYAEIELGDWSNFYQIPLLLPADANDTLECQECYQIISLTIFRLLFNSLDNVIYFESKFNFRSKIIESLDQSPIIDQISILKNYVLVQTGLLGGPTEKVTPPYELNYDFSHQLIYNKNYPIEYALKLSEEIPYQFISNPVDEKCLLAEFINYLNRVEYVGVINLRLFWEHLLSITRNTLSLGRVDLPTNPNLSEKSAILVQLFLDYALSHNWLNVGESKINYYENILINLPQTNQYLFLTCYLISNGDLSKTNRIYDQFVNGEYLIAISNLKELDLIVKLEIPRVYYSLAASNLTPSDVVSHWSSQLYWNVLDMSDVISIMLMSVLKRTWNFLYWSVALFKLYETDICSEPKINLNVYFAEYKPRKLVLKRYLDFVQEIEKKYQVLS